MIPIPPSPGGVEMATMVSSIGVDKTREVEIRLTAAIFSVNLTKNYMFYLLERFTMSC